MAAVKTRTVTEKGFIPESAVIELWAAYYLKAVQERHAQLHRHIKGENKGGIRPLDTVVELRREGLMSKETAQRYLEIIRLELLLKKKKKPRTRRSRLPRTLYRKRRTA